MAGKERADVPDVWAVVIAASAGGINALYKLLDRLPSNLRFPIVVVQHRAPMKDSRLAALLSRHTRLQVKEACHGDQLKAGVVYLAPTGAHLLIGKDGVLSLSDAAPESFVRPSANVLFRSAALAFGHHVVGVVLSGSGSDGAEGIRAIHEAGGFTIAQNWDSSAYFGMPAAAIATGVVDAVLPLSQIANAIVSKTKPKNEPMSVAVNGKHDSIEDLLDYLRDARGFDFRAYKRSSLTRRLNKRMSMIGVHSYGEYLDYLEVHPDEFAKLFDTILINVTDLFRDGEAWQFISETVIPRVLEQKRDKDAIRVWSAGCATGQEAYSLAIAFAEKLGAAKFREQVKIYATDLDEGALNVARQACYSSKDVQGAPEELLEKYFEHDGTRYCFDKDLRRNVIFGRHDLIQDAPISRIDLLVCRNALMYFNAETQARILARFHFALNDDCFLFLGKAETLLTHTNLFTPVDLRMRVFTKLARPGVRDRLLLAAQAGIENPVNGLTNHTKLREAAMDAGPVAQLIVDTSGALCIANERARQLFHLTVKDIGRPLQDLEVSYKPVELRSLIEQALIERKTIVLKDIEWKTTPGELGFYTLQVAPVIDTVDNLLGTAITFADVTLARQLHAELQHYNQELETAYEELQSTNEELQTTNEELQSTVEELETTNEELQSTNEELETMNEELQSTNEELETINTELSLRTNELNRVNTFIKSILSSLRDGVVVLDPEMVVLAWNTRSEDLWGLREQEVVGKHFLNLDIGLPVEKVRPLIRESLQGDGKVPQELTVGATNRRGKAIDCVVTCTPLNGHDNKVLGSILVTEEKTARA